MIQEKFDRDNAGYLVLDDKTDYKEWKTIEVDGLKHYFKSLFHLDEKDIASNLSFGCGSQHAYAEIVNSKVIESFGIDTAKYDLARFGSNRGVVSEDFNSINPNSILLGAYLIQALKVPASYLRPSLQFFKNFSRLFSEDAQKQLEMISLVHVETGQFDGHYNNLAFNGKRFTTFDNAYCYPSDYTESEIKNIYDNFSAEVYLGVTTKNQRLDSYYNDLAFSDAISADTIRQNLVMLKNFLKEDNGFKKIKEELKEEYIKPSSRTEYGYWVGLDKYCDKLKFVMETTGEHIEDALSQRC